MKQIYSLLLYLFFVAPAFAAGQQDPFKTQERAEWHLKSIEEKPFQLEVAYGEIERSSSDEPHELKIEDDPDFLDSSTILSIAVSSNESGEVKENERHTAKYRVSENQDGSFDLKIYLETLEGGLRETNTDITLNLSEWIVVGGLTRTADDETQLSYITAIRITPRTNKAGDDNSE